MQRFDPTRAKDFLFLVDTVGVRFSHFAIVCMKLYVTINVQYKDTSHLQNLFFIYYSNGAKYYMQRVHYSGYDTVQGMKRKKFMSTLESGTDCTPAQ